MEYSQNESLLPYNTFHFDCIAAHFVRIQNKADLEEFYNNKLLADLPCLILGGGSNILLTHDTYAGVVIKNEITGVTIDEIGETHCLITVGAGTERDTFVQRSLDNDFFGLENLSWIPWSVWGAPVQNIWAYGEEVKTYITQVTTFDLTTGDTHLFNNVQCNFWYRRSIFKEEAYRTHIITHVQFRLPRYDAVTYVPNISYASLALDAEVLPTPHTVAIAIKATRASKLPDRHTLGTAGSFFKNPTTTTSTYAQLKQATPDLKGFPQADGSIKLSAGQLIELAGFKGYTTGHVGTYAKHALVLVHHGWGTGQELLALVKQIQDAVEQRFGITLAPEVCIIE
jgi:UDP-N-acetylmuramate dehydrogenase